MDESAPVLVATDDVQNKLATMAVEVANTSNGFE